MKREGYWGALKKEKRIEDENCGKLEIGEMKRVGKVEHTVPVIIIIAIIFFFGTRTIPYGSSSSVAAGERD